MFVHANLASGTRDAISIVFPQAMPGNTLTTGFGMRMSTSMTWVTALNWMKIQFHSKCPRFIPYWGSRCSVQWSLQWSHELLLGIGLGLLESLSTRSWTGQHNGLCHSTALNGAGGAELDWPELEQMELSHSDVSDPRQNNNSCFWMISF
jgi:hypothetical protein